MEIKGTFMTMYKASQWHYRFKDDQEFLDNQEMGLKQDSHGLLQGYISVFTTEFGQTQKAGQTLANTQTEYILNTSYLSDITNIHNCFFHCHYIQNKHYISVATWPRKYVWISF